MASLGFLGALGGAGESIQQTGQALQKSALEKRRMELQARLQEKRDATQNAYDTAKQEDQQAFQSERDSTAFAQQQERDATQYGYSLSQAKEQAELRDRSTMKSMPLYHDDSRIVNGVMVDGQTDAQTGKFTPYVKGGDSSGVGTKAYNKKVETLVDRFDKGFTKSFGKEFIADEENAHIQRNIETAGVDILQFSELRGLDEQPERLAADFMNFASDKTRFPNLNMKTAKQTAYQELKAKDKSLFGGLDPDSPEVLKRAREIQESEADRLGPEYIAFRYGEKKPETTEEQATGTRREQLKARLSSNAPMFQEGSGEDRSLGESARDIAGKAGGMLAEGAAAAQQGFQGIIDDHKSGKSPNPVIAATEGTYDAVTSLLRFGHDLVSPRPKEKLPPAVLNFEKTRKDGGTPSKQQVAELLKWLSQGDNVNRLQNPEDLEAINALAQQYRSAK